MVLAQLAFDELSFPGRFATGLAATLWTIGLFLLFFGTVRLLVHFVTQQDWHAASY